MTVADYEDLPLAGRKRRWDADAAEARVRRWAKAESAPNERYRKAFLWYDGREEGRVHRLQAAHRRRHPRQAYARCLAGSWPPRA